MYDQQTIEEQQEIARDVILKIKAYFDPQAFLAGGAPSNWLRGQPARDLDIFFRSAMPTLAHIQELIMKVVPEATHSHCDPAEIVDYKRFMPGVRRVVRIYMDALPIDLVQIHEYEGVNFRDAVLNLFNSNVCRVAWDGNIGYGDIPFLKDMEYFMASDFQSSRKNGLQFEYRHPRSGALRFRPSHVLRMVEKFPEAEITFVQPVDVEQLTTPKYVVPFASKPTTPCKPVDPLLFEMAKFFPINYAPMKPRPDELFIFQERVWIMDHEETRKPFHPVLEKARFLFINGPDQHMETYEDLVATGKLVLTHKV